MPLIVAEPTTTAVQKLLRQDPVMLVWWATEVECTSAIARLVRDGQLGARAARDAEARLATLAEGWNEVQPMDALRRTAQRLLRVHPLRTGDALQLAAAVVASEGDQTSLGFVCLDDRLTEAARREGFPLAEV